MMGALATSGATAGYVVASKLSMLLLVGHQLINLVLTPRIGKFLGAKNLDAVHEEYHQSRVVGLIFAMLGACLITASGPWMLGLFGGYGEAMPVILILSATYVSQVSFGMCGGYLNIAGYASLTLTTTGLVLILNLSLNYLLIPVLGALGAALAMLLSISVTNALTAYLVLRLDGVRTYSVWVGLVTASSVGVLVVAAFDVISHLQAGLALLFLIGVFMWSERRFIRSLLYVLLNSPISDVSKLKIG